MKIVLSYDIIRWVAFAATLGMFALTLLGHPVFAGDGTGSGGPHR